MAYTLVVGGTREVPLASIQGWADVKDWGTMLSHRRFDALIQFLEHGITERIDDVYVQAKEALRRFPPGDKTVTETVVGLIEGLRDKPADSSCAFVSDGMGPDNGGESSFVPGFEED